MIGLGKRYGDMISFIFQYKETPFMNRFVWEPNTQSWVFELTYEKDGQIHTFATKRMFKRSIV